MWLGKKVVITDDALVVGQDKILWENISGLSKQDNQLLRKISSGFPRADIFLKGGKVITISNINNFQNQSSFVIDHKEDAFQSVIGIIKNKAPKIVIQSTSWLEWRLLLPVIVFEIFIGLWFILAKRSIEVTVNAMIIVGILGALLGWVWERQARKKRFS